MEYLRRILDNQDSRTQKTKIFEKKVMKIINNESEKDSLIKDISNRFNSSKISENSEINEISENPDNNIDALNKIISESFLNEFKEYGQVIQTLNSELRSLIQEIEKLKTCVGDTNSSETSCKDTSNNKILVFDELIEFINRILQFEKSNFELLIKMLQTSLKISQYTNILMSNTKSPDEENKIREDLKLLDIDSNQIYKNLSLTRQNLSDLITEKKYLIIMLNE